MSILDNVMNRFGFISQKQFEEGVTEALKRELEKVYPWMRETADAQQWSIPDPAKFANQADMYRLSPILGTAVDLLGRRLGTSKFNVKRMRGEDEIDIPNHPFELLLRNPNPMDSGLELMQDTGSNYELNGNSVWWLNKTDRFAPPTEIWTIPYHMIEPVPDGRLYLSHYNYFPGNGKDPIRFETWEILHLKNYNPFNRFFGLSPIESLAVTLVGDQAMRKTNTNNYVDYGGTPQGILAFKDFVPNNAWNDIKSEKKEAAKRNEMMMLRGVGDGITWMQRAMSNKDSEFISILKANMTDVFNRMCPGLLAMLDPNSTEANALAARATFAEYTLYPLQEAIAQKITLQILPSYGIKLVGHFDDPRVVDRKLELDEQNAFERSHTLEEVRREYYQDEPLGDERDNELMANLKTPANLPQKPIPQNNQPVTQNQDTVTTQDTGQQDLTMKARRDELLKWRRMALKGKAKASEFQSTILPPSTMSAIKQRLSLLSEKEGIAALFDAHLDKLKPQEIVNPADVLRGIELGVRALEMKKG